MGVAMYLRDRILQQLQMCGRQSASQVAGALGRNPKLVMRELSRLADDGAVVFDRVPEMRFIKLKGWAVRSFWVRYYRLPIRTGQHDPLRVRWTR